MSNSKDLAVKYLQKINASIKSSSATFINIKCPLCNEGHSSFKARGYVLLDKEAPIYYCHNCLTEGISFYNFLSQIDAAYANDYKLDIKKEKLQSFSKSSYSKEIKTVFSNNEQTQEQETIPNIVPKYNLIVKTFSRGVYTINKNGSLEDTEYDLLELSDEAVCYLLNRGFTEEDIQDFKFIKESGDIVIPMWYDKPQNLVYGMQMRSIYEKRFHNQNFRDNHKVWNLMYCLSLPKGSTVYVAESIFDAMSTGLPNILGAIGRTLSKEVINLFKDYKLVFLFDADESGDKSTLKYSLQGYSCLLHQKDMYAFKDFNKLLELGQPKEEIAKYIENNVASGLKCSTTLKLRGVSF